MKYFKMLPVLFLLGACSDTEKPKDCEITEITYYSLSPFNQWVGPTYRVLCVVKEKDTK